MSSEAKYHHLIPQTYLRKWCYSGNSIYSFPKEDLSKAETKNIAKHFGIDNYHSIQAGMLYGLDKDLEKIYTPLAGIVVEYEGKILTTVNEYNKYFFDSEKWVLRYKNTGSLVPVKKKNKILQDIKHIKVIEIEELWSKKYENGWTSILRTIEQNVLNADSETIPSFSKEQIIKFTVSLDWRSYTSNSVLNDVLEWFNRDIMNLREVDIPKEERTIKTNTTALEEIKHSYLLSKFNKFLNEEGPIYDIAMGCINKLTIKFLISQANAQFITSDNPSFTVETNNGLIHFMPISPEIMICLLKGDLDRYYVERIDEKETARINSLIIRNAYEFVMYDEPIITFDKTIIQI